MTATLELQSERRSETALGPRERRRLEQQRSARRRHRKAAVVAAAALTLVVALAGVLALVGPRSGHAPAVQPAAPLEDGAAPAAAPPGDAAAAPVEAAAPADPADDRVRLQLLNGIGAPGVAESVGDLLPEGEFRVVVADNAPEFGVRETRLLVYDDDPASLAAAERLRQVLGAGTISVSRQPQSVVDVTVIIGRDIDGS